MDTTQQIKDLANQTGLAFVQSMRTQWGDYLATSESDAQLVASIGAQLAEATEAYLSAGSDGDKALAQSDVADLKNDLELEEDDVAEKANAQARAAFRAGLGTALSLVEQLLPILVAAIPK